MAKSKLKKTALSKVKGSKSRVQVKTAKKKMSKIAAPKKSVSKNLAPKKSASTKPSPNKPAPNKSQASKTFEKVQPLGDRLFVEVQDVREKRTAGGLYIPDTVALNESYYEGIVRAVGSGRRSPRGKLMPMDVAVGDKVLFATYAGTAVEMNHQKYFFVNEDQVIGIKKP